MSEDYVRYDITGMSSLELSSVREMLAGEQVRHGLAGGVLVVESNAEAFADAVLELVERDYDLARAVAAREERIAAGDTHLRACEVCGNAPAAPIRLRRQVGLVVVRTMRTLEVNACDQCAAEITKDYQKQTALKGWTGVISALTNPVVLAGNARNRRRHRKALLASTGGAS